MGVFDDKKFETLDWMTQITETIDSELNGILAQLPDEIVYDFHSISTTLAGGYGYTISTSVNEIVHRYIRSINSTHLSYDEENKLCRCFKLEASEDLELDYDTKELRGRLALIKVHKTIEDDDLQKMMGQKGIERIHRVENNGPGTIARANEILDMLGGCEDAMKNRSINKKAFAITVRLRKIFAENEWRIRDMDLADKIGYWIESYINTGNLAALTNFCKIKVMTHNNMPIYSIEEEK